MLSGLLIAMTGLIMSSVRSLPNSMVKAIGAKPKSQDQALYSGHSVGSGLNSQALSEVDSASGVKSGMWCVVRGGSGWGTRMAGRALG
jgi:hypothetical protein